MILTGLADHSSRNDYIFTIDLDGELLVQKSSCIVVREDNFSNRDQHSLNAWKIYVIGFEER